jgi:outer membrane protein OmpA-like peptidoglycan-associated protein
MQPFRQQRRPEQEIQVMNIRKSNLAVAAAVSAILMACSSQPARIDTLETARSAVQQVESSPDAGKYAAAEVTAAHEALQEADQLVAKKKPRTEIEQAAYLAKRHADVATEQISRGQAEQKTSEAEAARQKVVLQAREQEATAARMQAEASKQQAEAGKVQADAERLQAQLAAEAAQRNAASLEAQLRDLQAKQTDRGLVLTLGDVLFDSGQATLKPGAASTIDRLAAFLVQAPERSVAIEGHTDSMGSDAYNLSLSENRANSVKAALVAKGIQAQRIVAVGKGEGVPVASNDNSSGRQQNRRVEIIVSNPPALAQRQ